MNLIKKLILPVILLMMAYVFWNNSNSELLAAGVAIFLFGMLAIEDGFKRLSGGLLERMLRFSTDRLWKSLSFGIITTSLMQSSSLVSVLTISFLSAGLIELAGGIGIVFGANIGTTTGAWLLASFGLNVKLSAYAMPLLAFGMVFIFQSGKQLKALGWVLAGVGFIFLGIQYLKDGFDVLKETIDLASYAMPGIKGLLLYTLIGMVVTVVMQSSHGTLVLIITALAANQVSYENALALSIGANVGTTITAIVGSISANIDGKRLAGAHLIFNFVTAVVAILMMKYIMVAVEWLADVVDLAADNYTLRLAIFHSLFNVLGVVLVAPFVKPMVRFLQKVMPAKERLIKTPKYLSPAVLESSHATVMAVKQESDRLYKLSLKVIANGIGLTKKEMLSTVSKATLPTYRKPQVHEDINEAYATRIKFILSAIVEFVVIARTKNSGAQGEVLQSYSRAVRELALAVKAVKHLQKNLLVYISARDVEVKYLYNELRWMIISTVRTLEQLRELSDAHERHKQMKLLAAKVTKHSSTVIREVEANIRKRNFSAQISTSLITDTEYAHRACEKLISTCKQLMVEATDVKEPSKNAQSKTEINEIFHDL